MSSTDHCHDYLILGAGPAGLQLGYFLERSGRDYLILEAAAGAGSFFEKFPRHRMLISSNKVYTGYEDPEVNLRFDWNSLLSDDPELLFKNYSRDYFPAADTMVDYLRDFARRLKLQIRYETRVRRISRDRAGRFLLEDENGNVFTGRRLVVATGFHRPYVPDIPGIELADNYVDMSVDPDEFENQRVLVIGKGNSGFETADNLIPTTALIHVASPTPLNLAWKSHFVGHLRAVNNNFLDTYQLKSQNAVLDCTIQRIEKRGDRYAVAVIYSHAGEEEEELWYDRVLVCAGFRFDDSVFDESCRPELAINNRLPNQTSAWESTNVPHLYFAGVLTQMRDYKKTTSGFVHGFRYNVRSLHHILAERYHDEPWPRREVPATVDGLTQAVIERVNQSSALWQQFGFLGDLITVDGTTARWHEELPVDHIHDGARGQDEHYYILTLEFGKFPSDPFNIERNPVPEHAADSAFLHPVIRRYRGPELVSELHLLENLLGEWWSDELHFEPLREYFERDLAREAQTAASAAPTTGVGAGVGA